MKKRDLYYERIPTKLLREDIRYLGTLLGEVIKDQEGIKFFKLVEKVRRAHSFILGKNLWGCPPERNSNLKICGVPRYYPF